VQRLHCNLLCKLSQLRWVVMRAALLFVLLLPFAPSAPYRL
jgi:hypothetical protein